MDVNTIVFWLVAWGLVASFVLILMQMAGNEDRAARREQQRMIPDQDDPVTSIDW